MLSRASELKGFQLEARDGTIGRVKDLLFDDETWTIRYIVADTGGWLTGRRVLLSPRSVKPGAVDQHRLPVDLTRAQIERSPGIEEDQPVSEQYQRDLHAYYGWPAYWGVGPYPMAGTLPPVVTSSPPTARSEATGGSDRQSNAPERTGDPHLRSSGHVTGYRIQATDGTIGHVEDVLVDFDAWVIRGIVVDTRNWLPGRKVVLPSGVVDRVSWTDSAVAVHLSREAIKGGPEYRPDVAIPADFEQRLAAYYDELAGAERGRG